MYALQRDCGVVRALQDEDASRGGNAQTPRRLHQRAIVLFQRALVQRVRIASPHPTLPLHGAQNMCLCCLELGLPETLPGSGLAKRKVPLIAVTKGARKDFMENSAHAKPAPRALSEFRGSTIAALVVLAIGVVLFSIPTLVFVIQEYWSREDGAHGPIVLFTGIWLIWRQWGDAIPYRATPQGPLVWLALCAMVVLQVMARITQIVELEGFFMYGGLLAVLYAFVGGAVLRRLWFPLVYIAFIFPPPETLVATVTVPMKMWLSVAAIRFLDIFGYPIGGEGVRIYIGQYELLVAAACAGINSIISLSAISLFYIYVRHQAEWRYAALLVLFIVPIALLANFVRVLILILLTYYAGEAAAQGFLHNFAGIVMFAVALASVFALDSVLKPLWNRIVPSSEGGQVSA